MPDTKQPSFVTAFVAGALRLFGFTCNGHQQTTPQRTQPVTVDLTPYLAALDEALTNGADPEAIRTAFTALSRAERHAQWPTGEALSHADQMAAWEQSMEQILTPYTNDPALADSLTFLRRLLNQNPDQPLETVAVSAPALYQTFLAEGSGDVIAFAHQIARTNTLAQIAANQDLIVSLAHLFGQQTASCVLPYIHRLKAEQAERARASFLGTDIKTGEDVLIPVSDRPYALTSFGAIGSGKSTLALNLILQDCRNGRGVVLIEPHGDLTRAVLAGLPESRLDDVVYLDLIDCATAPFGLNPFQCDTLQDAAEVAKCANFVHHTFMRTWDFGHHTPVLAMVLRHVTRTLIENPGSSFADIPLLFHEDTAREKLVSNVTAAAPHTKAFWQRYNTLSPRERRDLISSTENKIDAYLSEPLIANILSQAKTTIAFGNLFNERKIVLLNLSPQLEEISRLLGSLILGRILMSAYQRASVPEAERVPCCVYVDEWSRFCSDDLAVLIAESRKFKVIIGGLFNQTLETISDSNRATALQAGTLVVFRVSAEDSKVLCGSYDASPTPEIVGQEPVRAPANDPITYLVHHGHPDTRVAKFAQSALLSLENYLRNPCNTSFSHYYSASLNCYDGTLHLTEQEVRTGRKLLNDCLYTAMCDKNANVPIPPLALYVLTAAQGDTREYCLSDYLKTTSYASFFGHHVLKGFKDQAAQLGAPTFPTSRAHQQTLINSYSAKQYPWMAKAVIQLITELHYCLTVLGRTPILIDTGQYMPKYRQRTYADMAGQIQNELTLQENYTARVKTLTGEHIIRTHPAPPLLPEAQVDERIRYIKQRMREQGLCRPAHEVEEEVRLRHEQLRQRNGGPPPSHTNGNRRRRNRPRPPDHT